MKQKLTDDSMDTISGGNGYKYVNIDKATGQMIDQGTCPVCGASLNKFVWSNYIPMAQCRSCWNEWRANDSAPFGWQHAVKDDGC